MESYRKLLRIVLLASALMLLPVGLCLFLIPRLLPMYTGSVSVLAILCPVLVLRSLCSLACRNILLVLDRTMVFQVEEVQTLSADGLERLDPPGNPDENWLTVMTEREGGRRLLVQGRQTSIPEETESLTAADRSDVPPDWLNILALGSPVLLLGLFILWVIERFMKRAYRLPAPEEDPEKE